MGQQTIESLDLAVGKLFDDFYTVPSFQREYVWGEPQVEQLLQDIHTEFSSNGDGRDSEYFIGSIVVCDAGDGTFDLIDGQQRTTTLYLLLCAIRDTIEQIDPDQQIDLLGKQIASADVDDDGNDVFRYRVSLQYEDSCGVLEKLAEAKGKVDHIEADTRSIENILAAYEGTRTFLRREFDDDVQAVRRFYSYLAKRVKLIRVKTASVAHALKVFETINDRGVGLDSMDLLKNLMFMNAKQVEFDKLKDEWKQLVDLLFTIKEKPLRFLRYFIFSRYDVERLREEEIYQWFVKNAGLCGYTNKPLVFVGQLLDAARAYGAFLEGTDIGGKPNRYLVNIRLLSGAARQHLILLLAGCHLDHSCRMELARQIENLFFAYIITREPTREFERRFARWAPELQAVKDREGLDAFVARHITPAKQGLAGRFALSLRGLREGFIQKYRIKYVLAKLTQHIDELAYGSDGSHADLETYINKKVWIEHILPQSPSDDLVAAFDKPDEIWGYIHRLGNLTLLESSINSSVGNGEFSQKQGALRQSAFLLTKSLGEQIKVGADTAIDRAVNRLKSFDSWQSSDIEARQEMIYELAKEAWEMPELGEGDTKSNE